MSTIERATTRTPTRPTAATTGALTHRVIADLIRSGGWSPEALTRTVAQHPELRSVHSYRLAERQKVTSHAGMYGAYFLPGAHPLAQSPADPQGCVLEGAEVAVDGGRLDLLWRNASGERWADELKSAKSYRGLDRRDIDEQLARHEVGALARFGDSFKGSRLVMLGAPNLSFLRMVGGNELPAFGEGEVA